MAKTDIEKKHKGGALAVAGADEFFAAPTVVNAEAGDRLIPVLHLYQGTAQESETFAPATFSIGDLVDSIEKRRVNSRRITVITGKKVWVRFEKGQKAPVYSFTRKQDVPADDLEWIDRKDGKKPHPLATEVLEFMVLVTGEPWPYVLRCKVKNFNAGRLLYELVERAKANKRFAEIELDFEKQKNELGTYAVLRPRDVGNVSPERAAEVVSWAKRLAAGGVKVQDIGSDPSGGASDDDVPI